MAQLTNINIFLKAKSPLGLIELQALNNQVNGIHYNYQTPMFDGKNWYCWFFADIQEWINPETIKGDALKLAKGEL